MPKNVFLSFDWDQDVRRVSQVKNIGALEEQQVLNANEWETVRRRDDASIKQWIDGRMRYKDCVIVLIGTYTYNSKWVKYEIGRGWNTNKGMMGIEIHNLKDPRTGTCAQGRNPFQTFDTEVDGRTVLLSSVVPVHNPLYSDPYNDIARNIERWVDEAIVIRRRLG